MILVTLVAQGLSLPWVVRKLRFDLPDDDDAQRAALEEKLAKVAHEQLEKQGLPQLAAGFDPALSDDHTRAKVVTLQKLELVRLRDAGEVGHELARNKEFELELELARLVTRTPSSH